MAGQMIVLAGVNAGAAAGGPTIRMTVADQIAAKIASLKYAITPATLITGSDGLLTGRDRATGALLVPAGSSASLLKVSAMGGHQAINTGGVIAAASLNLPAGSATSSYTVVMAVYMGNATINSVVNAMNPIMVMGSEGYIVTALRYYGLSTTPWDASYKGQILSAGSNTGVPWARIAGPTTAGWGILTASYDDATKQTIVGLNGINSSAVIKAAGLVVGSTNYWSIGYSRSAASLQDSGVGDCYIFSDSLESTPYGRERIAALVTTMKSAYGIA